MPDLNPYPSVSFSTLLRLAVQDRVQWVIGKDADIQVSWVMINPEMARGGEAALLPAANLTPEKAAAAVGYGIAAIAVLGDLKGPENYRDIKIPLACLPGQLDYQDTYRLLLTILINQRAHLMEWGNNLNARLTHLAAEGAGLQSIVDLMSEISGRGVVLQDKRMDVLAFKLPSLFPVSWEALVETMDKRETLPEILQDRTTAGQQNFLLTQNLSGDVSRLVAPINVSGKARGYLSIIGLERELDSLDHILIEQGAEVCAMEMSRSKSVREAEKKLKGDWLMALLQGELSPRDARLWTEDIGLDFSQAQVCMRFSWDASAHPSFRRLETLINAEVGRIQYPVLVAQLETEVVCFCQVPERATRPEIAITLGRSVLDKAGLNYPDSNPRCGIGTPVADLNEWNDSFRQAGQALEMAKRLSENRPLFFPDLSVYRLLMLIEHSSEVKTFYEELLGPLLSYDNGEELIRTLDAYFERNGNLKKTANALYIHRNTLLYRLERIQEITGLDLDDPETRLALQLTLRIHKMLGVN